MYPTVETVLAQIVAAAFVIGSYFVAQEVRVKRPRRKAVRRPALPEPEPKRDLAASRPGAAPAGELAERR